MPWLKICDSFADHPKVVPLIFRRKQGPISVWTLAGVWSRGNSTRGFIPTSTLPRFNPSRTAAKELVESGLWAAVDGGYQFHDWTDWNPVSTEEQREIWKKKKKGQRAGAPKAPKNVPGDVPGDTSGVPPMSGSPTPTPTPSPSGSPVDSQSSQTGAEGSEPPPLTLALEEPPKKPRKAKPPTVTGETWLAYAAAYEQRYDSPPIRNARVNGQLAKFVRLVGEQEAPAIAGFYVTHNGRWYVQKGHPVGALLNDAETLRTEWITDRKITSGDARQSEQLDEMKAQSRRIEKLKASMGAKGEP